MVSKLLKIELLFLFCLTIFSFVGFYYSDSMPDHFLSISSSSSNFSFLSYYLSSFVALINFYIGPWIFLPFLVFALFLAFLYSRRSYLFDIINIVFLLMFFLFLTYFTYPYILGAGLFNFIKIQNDSFLHFFILILSPIFFLISTYRYSFFKGISSLFSRRSLILDFKLPNILKFLKNNNKFNFNMKKSIIFAKLGLLRLVTHRNLDEKNDIPSNIDDYSDNDESVIPSEDKIESFKPAKIQKKTIINEGHKISKQKVSKIPLRLSGKPKEQKDYYELVGETKNKKKLSTKHPDSKYFDNIIQRVEEKLAEFKIDGHIINILKGPVVDTFELELGPGVKVSKVTSSAEDLSLALYGAPIRIVYPMKGRSTVGVEVPRNPREIIYLEEILDSGEFRRSDHKLPLAMGKDAFGLPFIVDLANMPHMLVAGATGAGKSVFINTILVSLLVKKTPKQMKLILIDPKQLELALYTKLPHLIMPVITEAKFASLSLTWAVQEMERRYSILKELGVRNIEGFNEKLKSASSEQLSLIHHFYENDSAKEYELPYIVIIVDEFADLILTKAGKEIENNICRLAAKARAAGIHLVLATQRPSVDVITGLIKSNFPTRVSFRVTTSIDSRTILNSVGAERLLGKGDMLYKHGVETSRVHSSFVDETEIELLTEGLSKFKEGYNPDVMEFLNSGGESSVDPYSFGSHLPSIREESNTDEFFDQAVNIVIECRSASASMLQRRLKVGYNRAANLIEEMEERGIIGPAQGAKPRKVLLGPQID